MQWIFRKTPADSVDRDHAIDELFNNNDVDLQYTLVRETIQNSLDARLSADDPVLVRFRFLEGASLRLPASLGNGLTLHLAAKLPDGPSLGRPCRTLVVEDFNTRGITGDWTRKDKTTPWYGFFWAMGRSVKTSGTGGRRGLGRNVFGISSGIRSFFTCTHRDGEDQPLVMGLSILGMHEHEGDEYEPIGHYAEPNGLLPGPTSDTTILQDLRETFAIDRSTAPGLSILVPFVTDQLDPKGTLAAAAYNYLVEIWTSKLVVEVDGVRLDRNSLRQHLEQVRDLNTGNLDDLLAFIDEAESTSDADMVQPPAPTTQPTRFEDELFTPEDLDAMRQRFQNGELVAVRTPIAVAPCSGDARITWGRTFIRKTRDGHAGLDIYRRGDMPVTGERKLKNAPVFGMFEARDPALVQLLASSEGAAHWHWSSMHSELHQSYRKPRNAVLMAKNSVRTLHDLLLDIGNQTDTTSLATFFPVQAGGRRPTTTSQETEPPPVDPPPAQPQVVRIGTLPGEGAIRVTASPEASFPITAELELAYDVARGNPFTSYDPLDFDLSSTLAVNTNGDVGVDILAPNRLRLCAAAPGFQVRIGGFDTNRDLNVRTSVEGTDA